MGFQRRLIPLGLASGMFLGAWFSPGGLTQESRGPQTVKPLQPPAPTQLAPRPIPGAPANPALPNPLFGQMFGQPGAPGGGLPASAFPNLQPANPSPGESTLVAAPVSVLPDWPLASLLPEKVRVAIHYAIKSDRLGRVTLYRNLVKALEQAGFERDPEDDPDPTEPENSNHVLFTGLLPSKSLEKVANLSHVRSLLLAPVDFDWNANGEKPVRVEMMMGRGSQRLLRDTSPPTHKALDALGFKEAVIYDTFQGTRLMGSLPTNQLLKVGSQLGSNPPGRAISQPFQPVMVVLAMPGSPLPAPFTPPADAPAGFAKVAPELRQALSEQGKVFRVEILLDRPFASQTAAIEELANWAPNLVFESLLGSAVTVVGSSESLRALANDPRVNAIRPGPVAHAGPFNPEAFPVGTQWDPMRPHPLSGPGKWVIGGKTLRDTVALIDADFRGLDQLKSAKEGLIRTLDLTRERDSLLQADPFRGPVNEMGRGTLMAKQLLATQPGVKLVLVRIDPSVPAMIQRVAKAIQGEDVLADELMSQRLNEIRNERIAIADERAKVEADWKENGDDFGEEPEALKKRAEYQAKIAAIRKKEMDHHKRLERYLNHQKGLKALQEVRLVLCPLVWHEGLPRGGASPLSRWFDDRPFRSALWVQASGDRPGQTWTGMFRDQDQNGVMEWTGLAPGKTPFALEEMGLKWRPTGADVTRDELPAGAKIRVTLQWREARDPYQTGVDRDSGRQPMANLRVRLVRVQPGEGKADPRLAERVTVAQPVGPALLIDHSPRAAVFESFVDLEVTQPGRYEARIEGTVPNSVIPESVPHLPVNRMKPEIHPVLWLKTLNPEGNAVWEQSGENPVVGVPGDSHEILSVGSATEFQGLANQSGWETSHLLDRLDLKPDLTVQGQIRSSTDSVIAAGQAILTMIHPDQDVRFWRRTNQLPQGLGRPGTPVTVQTR